MTKIGRQLILLLELIFLTSVTVSFIQGRHPSLETAVATVFVTSAVALLLVSLIIRKAHPRYALLAWLTLFAVFVCGMLFPVL
jgi:hypothetical protein